MARRAALLLALLVAAPALAAETAIPAAPTRWVTDPTAMLTPSTREQLDARLERYQQATGHQVIVWIGTTLGDAPLEEWAANAFRAWGIGRKGEDDGVAIFVFRTDHEMRIEVGYGVEDRLPDAYATRIVSEVMAPALRAGNPDEAIIGAVDQVLTRLGGEPGGVPAPALSEERPHQISTVGLVLGGLALVAFLFFLIRHPRLAMFAIWGLFRGGGFGGGGGGGGFSGGGGRSGGGGASGSW